MALDLSGKIGGIPVPVIGGVLGLALVGVLYFRSSSKAAANPAPQVVAIPDVGPGDQIDSTGTQDGGVASSVPMFGTNGTWTASALAWDVASNGTSPLDVQQAIGAYLEGGSLTDKQGVIINRILTKWGLPPQGVNGISTILPKALQFKDPVIEAKDPTPKTSTPVAVKETPYTNLLTAVTTPAKTSTTGSSITTNYSSNTGSIYNVELGGVSRPISESLVWSGAFREAAAKGQAVPGYSLAETQAIQDNLKRKGLG